MVLRPHRICLWPPNQNLDFISHFHFLTTPASLLIPEHTKHALTWKSLHSWSLCLEGCLLRHLSAGLALSLLTAFCSNITFSVKLPWLFYVKLELLLQAYSLVLLALSFAFHFSVAFVIIIWHSMDSTWFVYHLSLPESHVLCKADHLLIERQPRKHEVSMGKLPLS